MKQLKTARRHMMPPQQHLYNGLGWPALLHFERTSPRWLRNGIARTERVLAYCHRGWPMASAARPVGEPMLTRDSHQDGQWNKVKT